MVFALAADDDCYLTGVTSRSPQIIVLMAADRRGEMISSAEEIYGSGFTKILDVRRTSEIYRAFG